MSSYVHIYVERAIQGIKLCNVINLRVPNDLIPNMSNIMRMCCILVNLRPPILSIKVWSNIHKYTKVLWYSFWIIKWTFAHFQPIWDVNVHATVNEESSRNFTALYWNSVAYKGSSLSVVLCASAVNSGLHLWFYQHLSCMELSHVISGVYCKWY